MVVKVYISGISGNKEVKKRQQRVLMILDSKNIKYETIDITEPGKEDDKDFMQNNSKSNGGTVSDPNPRTPLPPQVFNDDEYCGDYDQFDLANEVDTLEQFLKVEVPTEESLADNKVNVVNGVLQTEDEEKESKEKSPEKSTESTENSEVKETPTDNGETESAAVRVSAEKEMSVEKEASPASPTPVETEDTPGEAEDTKESEVEFKETVEESASSEKEAVENGAVSSREQSEEKEETNEPKNLSEALIQSEQMASTE